jgi:hypothetical protein
MTLEMEEVYYGATADVENEVGADSASQFCIAHFMDGELIATYGYENEIAMRAGLVEFRENNVSCNYV